MLKGDCNKCVHRAADPADKVCVECGIARKNYKEETMTDTGYIIQSYEESKPRWISVTERLPGVCTPVQVCYIGYNSKRLGSDLLACRYEGRWCYWDGEPCSYNPCLVEITHWMPLPPPPTMEGEE